RPRRGLDRAAGEKRLQLRIFRRITDYCKTGAEFQRLLREQRDIFVGAQHLDGEFVRRARNQIQRVDPDRAGGAEDTDAPHGGMRPSGHAGCEGTHTHYIIIPLLINTRAVSSGAVRNTPSSRSITPPWPGIRLLASLMP